MQTTRTFIAIEVGPPASSVLTRFLKHCQAEVSNVRWIRTEQLHITLKFLGDLDNRELPKICEICRQALKDIEPFKATLKGLGTFPKQKPPRIVWAGIEQGTSQMAVLHKRLDESFSEIGIAREGRAFTPHLTLGRVGRGAQRDRLADLVQLSQSRIATEFEVDEILVLASLRQRQAVAYEPIDTIEL